MAHITVSSLDDPRPAEVGAVDRPLGVSLFLSLRPSQWTKNLFVFGALLFGQRGTQPVFLDPRAIAQASAAFAIFCALSGVVYLVNDVADRHSDRLHPLKRKRPIASGVVSPSIAITTAIVLGALGLGAAYLLRPTFAIVAATYVALQACYSGPLKHMVIIDVLTIAVGFVLRAAAGAVAIDVPISHWLLILIMLLALFLALSKRRHELVLLADGASSHRRILQEYSPYLLDQMIGVVTASTLVSYVIYTVSPETVQKFHTDWLGLTLIFPLYGIFRYLYLVHQKEGGGSPSDMLQNDRPLLACVALWALSVAAIIYGTNLLNG
ncbi:MAG TPA: decaprenyl-phosphate phosphoribosyltransferase [Vicinamibacterales bacterium]|jgi:4-hydroxybenzoate polyprenyltransferase|nr:decaprenyl-phosphate phosphoribosyltransferase [Vicinamibacterales bacterium]